MEILERFVIVKVGALKNFEKPRRFNEINIILNTNAEALILLFFKKLNGD